MKELILFELGLARKNRWIAGFAGLFAVLSALLLYAAVYTFSGTGHEGFSREVSSLMNLSLYLIPIISLLLGSVSVAGDRSDGLLLLLRSLPIRSSAYLCGKFTGLSVSLTVSICLGYGAGGLLFSLITGESDIVLFSLFLLFSLLLAYVYMALGCLIGSLVNSRITAIFSSLVVWFFSVLLYGMLIVVILPLIPARIVAVSAMVLISLNPADLLRVVFVMAMGDGGIYGPLFYPWSAGMKDFYCFLLTVAGILLLWLGLPLGLGQRFLERRENRG